MIRKHTVSSVRNVHVWRDRRACRTMATSTSVHADQHQNDESYQFMQRSKLPTMHFQASLPRLPIPALDKTCARFLAAVEPILTAAEYEQTQRHVSDFQSAEGASLHALLKRNDAANKHTSYISEPWFNMYLSDRTPLPLNYNPLIVMQPEERSAYSGQLVRAANLVISSLRFWRSLQSGQLEPEVYHMDARRSDNARFRQLTRLAPSALATYVAYAFKAFPLDMSQYKHLFGVSRIPELKRDRLVSQPDSRHIMVMRRGHIYAVDVLDANGCIEPSRVILARLQAVLQLDEKRVGPAEAPLGVLTAGNRDDWAHTRMHLVGGAYARNAELLQREVDSALFCLSLDSSEDPILNNQNAVPLLKSLLAGDARNRWFDKSISLLVAADGTAAINFEHSWGDGVAVLRYFNEIYRETTESPFVDAATVAAAAPTIDSTHVRPVDFQLDDRLRQDISAAEKKHAATISSLNMNMLRYPHLNKNVCKKQRVSPDSVMQLAFQLAYRRAFDGYVGTYESCSTAAFRHGRTETMRPCTMATKSFCESLMLPSHARPDIKTLRSAIHQCSALHGQLTKEAAMGQGFDRHLFALKELAEREAMRVPDFYTIEAYRKLNYNIISTSTLSSNALLFGCFGPVVRDGLGIGYSMQNTECGAIVATYEKQRDGMRYIESLEEAMHDIRSVIEVDE